MPAAVQYDRFGGVEVLEVRDVPRPAPGPGQVLVQVRAAGINPGEARIRNGEYAQRWPSTFPSGQGSDLAGVVAELGPGLDGPELGREVLGFTDNRAAQAEYVLVEAANLTPKPLAVSWDVAGPANHDWLRDHGITPVAYGDGLADRLAAAAPDGIDAFVDTHGDGYVELAIDLGVDPGRIDTIIDFAAVPKFGVHADGTGAAATAEVLAELADLVQTGELEVPIAAGYPLAQVRAAYTRLERGHTRGKIVLHP